MKRRILAAALVLVLVFALAACAKKAGGVYKLTKVSGEGAAFKPTGIGMDFTFTLMPDGTGNGVYNGTTVDLTWTETDSTVTVEGINGTLVFDKEGKNLILHDEGSILTFERQGDAPVESETKS